MVHRLRRVKLGNRRQHTEGIGSEKDHMAGVTTHARNNRIGDELYRVGSPGVFRVADVAVIRSPGSGIDDNILEHCAEPDRMVDLGFFFGGQVDALGIAATFNVEDAGFTPAMLIVPDQPPQRVGGERGLSGAG